MSDERGGRYYREARFFLAGDRPRAQLHTSEARLLMGEMRDSLAMGGPPIQIRYTQLQDGTTIKAVMMNGQYQAGIFSPLYKRGGKRKIVRYGAVGIDMGAILSVNTQNQIGPPFNTAGYPHGVINADYPQVVFGTDISNYKTYDEYKAEYDLIGQDVRPLSSVDDELSVGVGLNNWYAGVNSPVISWGVGIGDIGNDTAPVHGVFQAGKVIAMPCITANQRVLGAAVCGSQLVVVILDDATVTTSATLLVKVTPYATAVTSVAGSVDFMQIGTTTIPNTGLPGPVVAVNPGVYAFSQDGTKAVSVFSERALSLLEITGGGTGATFTLDSSRASYSHVGSDYDYTFISAAAYGRSGGLRVMTYRMQQTAVANYTTYHPYDPPVGTACGTPYEKGTGTYGYQVGNRYAITVSYESEAGIQVIGSSEMFDGQIVNEVQRSVCTPLHTLVYVNAISSTAVSGVDFNMVNMPIAYDLRYDVIITKSLVGFVGTEQTVTYADVDIDGNQIPPVTNVITDISSVTYTIGEWPSNRAITEFVSDATTAISATYFIPTNGVSFFSLPYVTASVVFADESDYVVMTFVGYKSPSTDSGELTASIPSLSAASFSNDGYAVGFWKNAGNFVPIPFTSTFYTTFLDAGGSFGLISVREEEEQ